MASAGWPYVLLNIGNAWKELIRVRSKPSMMIVADRSTDHAIAFGYSLQPSTNVILCSASVCARASAESRRKSGIATDIPRKRSSFDLVMLPRSTCPRSGILDSLPASLLPGIVPIRPVFATVANSRSSEGCTFSVLPWLRFEEPSDVDESSIQDREPCGAHERSQGDGFSTCEVDGDISVVDSGIDRIPGSADHMESLHHGVCASR